MKKTLLITAALLAAASPMPAQFKAQTMENAPFMSVSQNGKYGVFTIDGIMLGIVNLENPEEGYIYMDESGSEYTQNEYLPGYGTCVANDGTTVGNAVLYEITGETTYDQTDNAVIYSKGEMKVLPSPHTELFNMAHAITPDGSVICGNVGNDNFALDSRNIMMLPAVWYRNAEGEYENPVMLPHPDKDFLGGVPQYVTANAISADGNIVAGTITASSGFWVYPIVYTRDAAGEWSYKLPALDLFYTHPEVDVPENPGDYPELKNFMTQEEIDAYNAALQARKDAGTQDWTTYPYLEDFATDEENAAYQAACQKYESDKAAYDAAVDEATAGSITFTFNNVVLSPDGKFFASTYDRGAGFGPLKPGLKTAKYSRFLTKGTRDGESGDDESGDEEEDLTALTYVINIEDGSYKTFTHAEGASVTCAAQNGVFTGYAGDIYFPKALVMDPENGAVPMEEYYKESCPELTAWVDENMHHEVQDYDPETSEPIVVEKLISGIPFCTPDMKTLVSYAYNSFDFGSDAYYFGYVFQGLPGFEESGVKDVLAKSSELDVRRGGVIDVNGEAYVEVFATDGSKVFAGNASGSLSTGLRGGVYMVRATFADGKVSVRKAMF